MAVAAPGPGNRLLPSPTHLAHSGTDVRFKSILMLAFEQPFQFPDERRIVKWPGEEAMALASSCGNCLSKHIRWPCRTPKTRAKQAKTMPFFDPAPQNNSNILGINNKKMSFFFFCRPVLSLIQCPDFLPQDFFSKKCKQCADSSKVQSQASSTLPTAEGALVK